MERTPTQPYVLKFGVFEVDLASGELRKSGIRQNLCGQPFEVLRALLEHPGELVTREELRRLLWPDNTFVDYDLAIKRVMNRLREALSDSADNPRFIETIPRKGYRFIAPVSPNGVGRGVVDVTPEAPQTARGRALNFAVGLGAATVLLGLGFAVFRLWPRPLPGSPLQIHSLAVLPLQNLSADPGQEYFSDGMTDALITDLAQIGPLKVISRTSSMQYKQTKKSLPEIAHELNVDGIIEGTVQRSGDRVRITAQLIHGSSDKHLWANSYERDTQDVFALERDIADDISRQVQVRVMPNQTTSARPGPVNSRVLEAYIQGTYYLKGRGSGGGDEEQRKAQAYFQQALDADPNFAPAYIGLAEAHGILSQGSSDDFALMQKAAEKAVALDPSSSDGWDALATAKWESYDWAGCEEDCRRAISLNPNNARAHQCLGSVLDVIGRSEEAWKEYLFAQELDPNQDHLADPLYQRRQFDRAIEIRERIAKRDPQDGYNHYALGLTYAQKGMYKGFVEEMDTMAPLFGLPEIVYGVHGAYDRSGYQGALRQFARNLEHLAATKKLYAPGLMAQVYSALGDKNRAFYWLEQYRQHPELALADPTVYFKTDPWFAPLRSDPRFSEFLRRIGIPS